MSYETRAKGLDKDDALAQYRDRFLLNDHEVYLDGNSLGPLMKDVRDRIQHTVSYEWGERLIRSWNEHWIDLPSEVGDKIAAVIGAETGSVICTDSVSVNLFKLLAAAIQQMPERPVIVSATDMFPTDLYMAEGLSQLVGQARCELRLTDMDKLEDAMGADVNVLLLSQVNFRSGEAHDIQALTELAHQHGARVLWDLSHSAGVLPIGLADHQVDFAVGCGYKFLNGGPGATAYLYVNPSLVSTLQQPLCGWMGHASPFTFETRYQAAHGVQQFLSGTPGILGLSALDAAMNLWQDVALEAVFEKSQRLAQFFVEAVESEADLAGFTVIRPANRGSQVSLAHIEALPVSQALIDAGMICDFRAPNLVRFGFSPFYTRFSDLARTVRQLRDIMRAETYRAPQYNQTGKVT